MCERLLTSNLPFTMHNSFNIVRKREVFPLPTFPSMATVSLFLSSKLISLKAVKYLILDEADRILDLGFSDQLNSITFNYGKFL